MFVAFIFWLVFAILVGVYASSKGRSGLGFFFIAILLSPLIGFIIALIVQPMHAKTEARAVQSGEYRKCPYCAELVKAEAIVCKHCGRDLPANAAPPKQSTPSAEEQAAEVSKAQKICWNCSYYKVRNWDASTGKCTLHNRKTYASDTCGDFATKYAVQAALPVT